MSVADHTGQAWLQGFNDVGEKVFGKTANELIALRVCHFLSSIISHDSTISQSQDNDESQYSAAVQKAICSTYNFTCRAKQDTYNVC